MQSTVFRGRRSVTFGNPRNLLATTAFNADAEKWTFEDQTAVEGEYYTYVVTAFNRPNVESYSSELVFVKKRPVRQEEEGNCSDTFLGMSYEL
ncbi:MAG: hypothetical protein IPL27_26135 [Lewinellaceae bacterium]|nr:hypothetical protein [Lewinellaceae bacterium]